ncbi:vitellogenin-2-like [Tachypleus tridentatus]|uniref:vitellogenin-2-like n=1 Tax=Tachypleus tridentatus TaxID=6853 RepID=UPI003FD576CE
MCFNSIVKFPPKPNVFLLDTVLTKDQNVDINADIIWGSECLTSQEKHISVNAIVEKSNEQKNVRYEPRKLPRMTTLYNTNYISGLSGQWSLPWYYKQCQIDQQLGKSQSYACKLAIVDDSYLNKITMEINYQKVPPYFVNLTHHIDLALKAYLYPLVDNNAVNIRNSEKKIRIIAEFVKQVPGVPLLNLFIEKPTENTYIRKIYLPYVKPLSLLVPPVEDNMRLLWNSKVEPVCSVMERYIQTLDNVTFPMPETQCQYLLSKDCSPEERYAVLLTPAESAGLTKTLLVYVLGHEIKLLPSWQHSSFEVIIDQQTYQLVYGQPLQIGSVESPIYFYLEETLSRPIVVVQAEVEGLLIKYDGVNAEIKVSPKYMGRHCGLCGDFNGESYREFLGPNSCIYTDSQDFVNSYVLGGQQCQLPFQPFHPFVCPPTYYRSLYRYTKPLEYLKEPWISPSLQTQPMVKKYTPYSSWFQTPTITGIYRPNDDRERFVSPFLQTPPIVRKYTPYSSWFQLPSITDVYSPVEEDRCTLKKVWTKHWDNNICFSKEFVPVCKEECIASSETQEITLNFFCLPENSPHLKDLFDKVTTGKIEEIQINTKRYVDKVEVPQYCRSVYP